VAVRFGRVLAATPFILAGTSALVFANRAHPGTHNTRRGGSPATLPCEASEEHSMLFFDSAIQFLGFDGWSKCESL